MTNLQGIFKREKELCELFQNKEEEKKSYHLSREGLVIWVYYDTEDDWYWKRGEPIISTLIKNVKLDKVGYKEKSNILRY